MKSMNRFFLDKSQETCHHEGIYTNWRGERICPLCDAILGIEKDGNLTQNMRRGIHLRQLMIF